MTTNIYHVANTGAYDDFIGAYRSHQPDDAQSFLDRALCESVGNINGDRTEISLFLLRQGADATYVKKPSFLTCLHILFSSNVHDFEKETRLLIALLSDGADINASMPTQKTPLQTLASAANFKFSDDDLSPFYDVIFDQEDLDLLKIGAWRKSTYASVCRWVPERAQLVERMNTYLTERSIPIPNTQETMTE